MKYPVAQTNLQLYNQMQAAGYPDEDLATVRNAYEYGLEIFTGKVLTSSKVFVEHGIGAASVLAQIGEPASMVAAGILHNIFWNGVWEDGTMGITAAKREDVRRRLGDEILPSLERFHTLRWNAATAKELLARFDELDQATYQTILLRLADHVDHLTDGGIAYSPNAEARIAEAKDRLEPCVALAEKLGYPELGAEIRALTERAAALKVPAPLRATTDMRFAWLVAPRSHRMKYTTRIRQALWRGIGIRKALRQLFGGGRNG